MKNKVQAADNNTVAYSDIAPGTLFEYDGAYYMKADETRPGDSDVIAIDLEGGILTTFEEDVEVLVVPQITITASDLD